MTGHKSRSVFERYNIVSDTDLKDAARRLDAYQPACWSRSGYTANGFRSRMPSMISTTPSASA